MSVLALLYSRRREERSVQWPERDGAVEGRRGDDEKREKRRKSRRTHILSTASSTSSWTLSSLLLSLSYTSILLPSANALLSSLRLTRSSFVTYYHPARATRPAPAAYLKVSSRSLLGLWRWEEEGEGEEPLV